jgi:hypothetical protein
MDLDVIREQSLKTACRIGVTVSEALPLLDKAQTTKATNEIISRLLCLHATAACAHGFDRGKARAWLEQELLSGELTAAERQFLEGSQGDPDRFKVQVEGMWALAWALGIVPRLDFDKGCDDSFVTMLPNLKVGEKSDTLRSKVKLRSIDEVFSACDLAYCLHWAVRQAYLSGGGSAGKVPPYVIEERRRALEWLLSSEQWDEVALDT